MRILLSLLLVGTIANLQFLSYSAPVKKATTKTNAHQAPMKLSTVKIKAGLALKSGDVKYVAKQSFYLTPKSYFIESMASTKKSIQPLDEWLKAKGASDELIKWSATDRTSARIGVQFLSISNNNFDSIDIPEFREAKNLLKFQKSCTQLLRNSYDAYKQAGCNSVSFSNSDKVPSWIRSGSAETYYYYEKKSEILLNIEAEALVSKTIYSSCTTNFVGECSFPDIKPGRYYLTSLNVIELGSNRVIWDVPITIKPGNDIYVELGNDNLEKASTFPRSWKDVDD